MKYNTLLFDLDGTLVNTEPGIVNCLKYALDTLKFDYTGVDFNAFIGPPLLQCLEPLLQNCELAQQAVQLYRERYSTIGMFECEVYEGIPQALDLLKQSGFKVATATSKPEPFAIKILEHFNLSHLFDCIAGATFDGRREQKQDVIDYAAITCGAQKQNCVMIGDRKYDLIGAQKSGVDAIGVLWGFGSMEELQEFPNVFIAKTPKGVCDYLLK